MEDFLLPLPVEQLILIMVPARFFFEMLNQVPPPSRRHFTLWTVSKLHLFNPQCTQCFRSKIIPVGSSDLVLRKQMIEEVSSNPAYSKAWEYNKFALHKHGAKGYANFQ